MIKEIILTPIAEKNYEDIIAFIIKKWGLKTTNNFILRFEKVCDLLAGNPEIYPFINKTKKIQKCVLTKHNVIYFREYEDTIKILTIFDTRQNPDKLSPII